MDEREINSSLIDSLTIMKESIARQHDFVVRVDELNKRLVKVIAISIITFCIAGALCFAILYLSDYTTTNVNQQQQQMGEDGMQQQQTGQQQQQKGDDI